MDVQQLCWTEKTGWSDHPAGMQPGIVMVFGAREHLEGGTALDELRERFPGAPLFGCSTAGEIEGTRVRDGSVVATALTFDRTPLREAHARIDDAGKSRATGEQLAADLAADDLAHVIVVSDGVRVNGSELVEGLLSELPDNVTVTGGLAGDGADFEKTVVVYNGSVRSGMVVALGLYGPHIRIGYASLGGWDPFGPERVITRSKGNVLYELDGQSALGLYKRYLGEHAEQLPASGLLYPLSLRIDGRETGVVRTILAIDEDEQSLTFAGDVPMGAYARLMKANFDRLIDGAVGAARNCIVPLGACTPEFGLLISCVGRKMILRQRIEEEVEGVQAILGPGAVMGGFYSYGEISPFTPNARCELHNQTMTITTLAEV
jgi:hypothetical protein